MPALPLEEAGKYVAGAYVVFVALILIYVAIIGAKIARISREIEEMVNVADRPRTTTSVGSPARSRPTEDDDFGG
ncbi:MAG: hypothetical protein M3433_01800 [Actinomycetota bacterium]|nr:hypothetical protein [Actinomycetota bacterium]